MVASIPTRMLVLVPLGIQIRWGWRAFEEGRHRNEKNSHGGRRNSDPALKHVDAVIPLVNFWINGPSMFRIERLQYTLPLRLLVGMGAAVRSFSQTIGRNVKTADGALFTMSFVTL